MKYITNSPEETENIGECVYKSNKNAVVFALLGDLGAGKTAFVRGVARAMGVIDSVSSPTYAIVNEYRGKRKLVHFDMYRVPDTDSLYEIGWDDYLSSGALCAVEWSENVLGAMPKDTLYIRIEKTAENVRTISVGDEVVKI